MALVDEYTKEEFIEIWNNSFSMREFARNLGYRTYTGDAGAAIRRRVDAFGLSDSHFYRKRRVERTRENVFCINSTADQSTLRNWFKKEPVQYVCSICGLDAIWQDKPLSLTLDHINGDNHDNRIENLRWVCPNCDRQLDTFGSKNKTHLPKKALDN